MLTANHRIVLYALALIAVSLRLDATEPIQVISPDRLAAARQPQAAIDEAGVIYITFGVGDSIYVCRSVDRGKTYEAPRLVGSLPKLALGMRRGPRIVACGNSVVISAISHASGELTAWRSSDGGVTWSEPHAINDSAGSAREGLHAMAGGPDSLFCVWLDLRNDGTQIYGSRSDDDGLTWSKNRRIYASPSGTVCECCHPSAAIDDQRTIYVMWRNELDGNRDMFLAKSEDAGETFSTAVQLGTSHWKLDACPMDGGFLAVGPTGQLTTIWRRQNEIFLSDARSRSEQKIALGEQPWAAANANGGYYVWLNRRPGDLWVLKPEADGPIKVASDATDPIIAASRTASGPVIVVWESGRKPESSIMAAVLGQ